MDFTTILLVIAVLAIIVLVSRLNLVSKQLATNLKAATFYSTFTRAFENAVLGHGVSDSEVPNCGFKDFLLVKSTVMFIGAVNAARRMFDQALEACKNGDVTDTIEGIKSMVSMAQNLAMNTQHYLRVDAADMLAMLDDIEHKGNVAESKHMLGVIHAQLAELLTPFVELSDYMKSKKVGRNEVGIETGDVLDDMLKLSERFNTVDLGQAEDKDEEK